MAASATLTLQMQQYVLESLQMHSENTEKIWLPTDHANICYQVRQMKFSANSYFDLAFLVPLRLPKDSPLLEPFMIFYKYKMCI